MNRFSLTVARSLMDVCWIYPWSALIGAWADPVRPRPLLSAVGLLGLVMLGALGTHSLGRRAASSRTTGLALALLGLVAVLVVMRTDQYPGSGGLEWLGLIAGALAVLFRQTSTPALAFALGLFVWWRGVRLGSQPISYSDVETAFRWGIGLLVTFGLIVAVGTRPAVLPQLEAQTTPFIVGFFFISLLALALGRLESLRTRTRALAINTQWLGVLVAIAGLVILGALLVAQLLSFDLLRQASQPLFDLLGQVVLLSLYVVIIPLAFVLQWIIYLVQRLLPGRPNQPPPQPLQPGDLDNALQRALARAFPPELLAAIEALGAGLLLALALLLVARAAARWRPASADAEATEEERDSLWTAGRLGRVLLAWLKGLLRRRLIATPDATPGQQAIQPAVTPDRSSIRALYRELLHLGESAGATRHPATTPLEHVAALQQALVPEDDVTRATEAYVQVRYAETDASPAEVAAARQQLDRLHRRPPDE